MTEILRSLANPARRRRVLAMAAVLFLAALALGGACACVRERIQEGVTQVPIRRDIQYAERAHATMTPAAPAFGFLLNYDGDACPDRAVGKWGWSEPDTAVKVADCARYATVWHRFWSDNPRPVRIELWAGDVFVIALACVWSLDGGTCKTEPVLVGREW